MWSLPHGVRAFFFARAGDVLFQELIHSICPWQARPYNLVSFI